LSLFRTSEFVTKPISILAGEFSETLYGLFFTFIFNVKKKYKEEKENRKTLEIKELLNA